MCYVTITLCRITLTINFYGVFAYINDNNLNFGIKLKVNIKIVKTFMQTTATIMICMYTYNIFCSNREMIIGLSDAS